MTRGGRRGSCVRRNFFCILFAPREWNQASGWENSLAAAGTFRHGFKPPARMRTDHCVFLSFINWTAVWTQTGGGTRILTKQKPPKWSFTIYIHVRLTFPLFRFCTPPSSNVNIRPKMLLKWKCPAVFWSTQDPVPSEKSYAPTLIVSDHSLCVDCVSEFWRTFRLSSLVISWLFWSLALQADKSSCVLVVINDCYWIYVLNY